MKRVLLLCTAGILAGPMSAQAPAMIRPGNVLSWSTSAGQKGVLKILSLDHLYFEADQINERNMAAGAIRLYGAILDGGRRIVLVQPGEWKCVWDGNATGHEITGTLRQGAGSYQFRIGPAVPAPVAVSTAPFLLGKTLRWSTGAGQSGHMRVTSVTGATFKLEQTNFRNRAAGVIEMHGEIRDGKVHLRNRDWNETWVGTIANGVVTGKINNAGDFRISE